MGQGRYPNEQLRNRITSNFFLLSEKSAHSTLREKFGRCLSERPAHIDQALSWFHPSHCACSLAQPLQASSDDRKALRVEDQISMCSRRSMNWYRKSSCAADLTI